MSFDLTAIKQMFPKVLILGGILMCQYPSRVFDIPNGGEGCVNPDPTGDGTWIDIKRDEVDYGMKLGKTTVVVNVKAAGTMYSASYDKGSDEITVEEGFPLDKVEALLEDLDTLTD